MPSSLLPTPPAVQYKRQLLNVLGIIYRYDRIKRMPAGERRNVVPRICVIGGKVGAGRGAGLGAEVAGRLGCCKKAHWGWAGLQGSQACSPCILLLVRGHSPGRQTHRCLLCCPSPDCPGCARLRDGQAHHQAGVGGGRQGVHASCRLVLH